MNMEQWWNDTGETEVLGRKPCPSVRSSSCGPLVRFLANVFHVFFLHSLLRLSAVHYIFVLSNTVASFHTSSSQLFLDFRRAFILRDLPPVSICVPKIPHGPIPVAMRSKAWVCGRSLTRIVGSNHIEGMAVCFL